VKPNQRFSVIHSYRFDTAQVASLVGAMAKRPSRDRIRSLNAAVSSFVSFGLWDKFDVMYFARAHDEQAAFVNWKQPGRFTLTKVGSPVFTRDQGIAGDATAAALATGWIPSTSGVNYVQNSATLAAFSRTAAAAAAAGGGIIGGTVATYRLLTRGPSDFLYYTANDATVRGPASTDGSGFFTWSRTGASAVQVYRNGAAFGAADTTASTTIPGGQLNLLRANSIFSASEISFGGAAGGLNATENANLYTVVNTFLNAA
jgi:hypothetical protein